MSRVNEKPKSLQKPLEQPKMWLGIAVALPVAIAAGVLATARIEQLKKLTSTVSVAPVPNTITAIGRLEPRGEVIKLSAPAGLSGSSRVERLLVREGQKVQQGQVVAILDSRDTKTHERLKDLNDAHKVFRCRTIMNCVDVCPKGLNPTQAIAEIRNKMLGEE